MERVKPVGFVALSYRFVCVFLKRSKSLPVQFSCLIKGVALLHRLFFKRSRAALASCCFAYRCNSIISVPFHFSMSEIRDAPLYFIRYACN
jgi:hypothetical protein